MTNQVIPAEAIEAAARAWVIHSLTPGSMTLEDGMRDILEAAAPHMLARVVARLDENVTALENTLVDEHDYPALCAQREALIGVMQMLREDAAS